MLFKNDNNRIEIPVEDSNGVSIDASDFTAAKFSVINPLDSTSLFTTELGQKLNVEAGKFVVYTDAIDHHGEVYIELRARDASSNVATLFSDTHYINHTSTEL